MVGSSNLQVAQQGNLRERTSGLGRLDERLRRERIGLDSQLSMDLLQAIERRDDVGPDYNQLIQLAEMLGQSREQWSWWSGGPEAEANSCPAAEPGADDTRWSPGCLHRSRKASEEVRG